MQPNLSRYRINNIETIEDKYINLTHGKYYDGQPLYKFTSKLMYSFWSTYYAFKLRLS